MLSILCFRIGAEAEANAAVAVSNSFPKRHKSGAALQHCYK
jgi:hypothetical protein